MTLTSIGIIEEIKFSENNYYKTKESLKSLSDSYCFSEDELNKYNINKNIWFYIFIDARMRFLNRWLEWANAEIKYQSNYGIIFIKDMKLNTAFNKKRNVLAEMNFIKSILSENNIEWSKEIGLTISDDEFKKINLSSIDNSNNTIDLSKESSKDVLIEQVNSIVDRVSDLINNDKDDKSDSEEDDIMEIPFIEEIDKENTDKSANIIPIDLSDNEIKFINGIMKESCIKNGIFFNKKFFKSTLKNNLSEFYSIIDNNFSKINTFMNKILCDVLSNPLWEEKSLLEKILDDDTMFSIETRINTDVYNINSDDSQEIIKAFNIIHDEINDCFNEFVEGLYKYINDYPDKVDKTFDDIDVFKISILKNIKVFEME